MPLALTRLPGPELAACELTHVARAPIDLARARTQHAAYVALLEQLGVQVTTLAADPALPDGVFVEDTAVVLEEVAFLPHMGAPSRRAESAAVASFLAEHRELVRLRAGTLDGGDVLVADEMLYVGQSTRTSHAALRELAHAVLAHGHGVKAVEVRGALHLKTACTYLGRGRLLANRRWIQTGRIRGLEFVDVAEDEPFAANVLRLGDVLVMSAAAPRTAARVAALGYDVRLLDISELAKAEAGLTCLSLVLGEASVE